MTPIKKGAAVAQVVPAPIKGEVTQVRYDDDAGAFVYLVGYVDASGEPAERWFKAVEVAEQLEETPETEGGAND